MENANYQKEQLNHSAVEMMSLAISQFEKATESFINQDADLAEEVIYKETRVNALDLKIERDCERYLALFNPVAVDLRFVMAVLKINGELERIADHAYGMSKYVVDDEDHRIPDHLFEVLHFNKMVDTVNVMFEYIVDAFENGNVKAARKVFKLDKVLDKINNKSIGILEEEIKINLECAGSALKLLTVVKKFERVGDLIKNIAEQIIFYQEVEILKHRKKKK